MLQAAGISVNPATEALKTDNADTVTDVSAPTPECWMDAEIAAGVADVLNITLDEIGTALSGIIFAGRASLDR